MTKEKEVLGQKIIELFEESKTATIVSPFITVAGITPILEKLPNKTKLKVFTRWIPYEVAAGVSDPQVISLLPKGSEVYLYSKLHAKVYINDSEVALVGSANVTATALGWINSPGLEILIPSKSQNIEVKRLLEHLENVSLRASESLSEQIIEAASKIKPLIHHDSPTEVQEVAVWLPKYNVPSSLWYLYKGDRPKEVIELGREDLNYLAPPAGLSRAAFKQHVAAIMLQSEVGKLIAELEGESSYRAIKKLGDFLEENGETSVDPEKQWSILVAWCTHFLASDFVAKPGGLKLSR